MSRSMIKQQNSGATAHVVLYTPRQSTNSVWVIVKPIYFLHPMLYWGNFWMYTFLEKIRGGGAGVSKCLL